MTLGKGLRAYLATKNAVTALLGATPAPLRCFGQRAPQGSAYPLVCYRIVNDDPAQIQEGASGTVLTELSIDAIALSYDEADAVYEVIRLALHGVGPGLWGDVRVRDCFRTGRSDLYEPPTEDDDVGYHHVSATYSVWHNEATN